jgi:hypothetical protein
MFTAILINKPKRLYSNNIIFRVSNLAESFESPLPQLVNNIAYKPICTKMSANSLMSLK